MGRKTIKLVATFPVEPAALYKAWLSGPMHGAMTGSGRATGSSRVGGRFSAGEGYITGKNLALEPGERAARSVQSWRTTDFSDEAGDSRLELRLDKVRGGTRLTLLHSELPEGTADEYRSGWELYYFEPMRAFFAGR